MSIRLRTINGVRVALCAAETNAVDGDMYLDDGDHYALAAKFMRDWSGQMCDVEYVVEWTMADSQKKRNAEEQLRRWSQERKS